MKKIIQTDKAPAAIGPYSQAVQANDLVFISGQIPLKRNGELLKDTIEEQTKLILENIGQILNAVNLDYQNIVKTTIFLKDLTNFEKVNQVYGSFFKENPPARSTIEVKNLPKNAEIEIEVVASKN